MYCVKYASSGEERLNNFDIYFEVRCAVKLDLLSQVNGHKVKFRPLQYNYSAIGAVTDPDTLLLPEFETLSEILVSQINGRTMKFSQCLFH